MPRRSSANDSEFPQELLHLLPLDMSMVTESTRCPSLQPRLMATAGTLGLLLALKL